MQCVNRAHPANRDARKKFDPLTEGLSVFALKRGEVQSPARKPPRKGEKGPKTIPSVSRYQYNADWTVCTNVNGQPGRRGDPARPGSRSHAGFSSDESLRSEKVLTRRAITMTTNAKLPCAAVARGAM